MAFDNSALLGLRVAMPLLVASAAALSPAQSLFSVPTGDTFKRGTLSQDVELDSGPRLRSRDTLTILSLRYGVSDRLTVGEDLLLTGSVQGQPSVSLGLYKGPIFSVAAGYENVGVRSFGEQPYATASGHLGKSKLHAGWTRLNHDSLMLGAEYDATDRLTLQADTVTGRDNFTTGGLQLQVTDRIALSAGYMHANDPSQGNGVFLDLNWTLSNR